jgi:hypothetical protein
VPQHVRMRPEGKAREPAGAGDHFLYAGWRQRGFQFADEDVPGNRGKLP